MNLPINVVVTHPPANQQQAVVDAARLLKLPEGRVTFEESPEGLLVHGLTELDIELAIYELEKTIPLTHRRHVYTLRLCGFPGMKRSVVST